jgi:WD40 repeat protein
MLKLDVSRGSKIKSRSTIIPKMVVGIRGDIQQNISYFSWDKCAYIAGNYAIIYSLFEKTQYFFEAHPDLGEITAFSADEYLDSITLVIAQKPQTLYLRFINKNNFRESEARLISITEKDSDSDYILSISVNALKNYIALLTTSKVVKIFQEEFRGRGKLNYTFKLQNPTAYATILINFHNPFLTCVYGEGGFAVFQVSEQDKKTVSKLEVLPNTFTDFSNYLFGMVSACWVNKTRLALINIQCDLFVVDFFNKNKLENVYKKVVKYVHIFDGQSRGKSVFAKSGSIFVCRDDCSIIKLEDKQQNEKNIIYEKSVKNIKPNQPIPRMDINCLSLSPPPIMNNFYAILITSYSSQIYYVNITNENDLQEGSSYKYLQCPFLSDEVTSMDVAKWKTLLATCSRDKYLCIWNFSTYTLEASESFKEEPLQVAFHPNSFELIVLFKEKMLIMHVSDQKLIKEREVMLFNPHIVKFNQHGNFLAVCNKNAFKIFDYHTMETVFSSDNFQRVKSVHSDEIRHLAWDEEGTGFVTCGMDGRFFYWKIFQEGTYHSNVKTLKFTKKTSVINNTSPQTDNFLQFYNSDYKFIQCEIVMDRETSNNKFFLCQAENISQIDDLSSQVVEDMTEDEFFQQRRPTVLLSGINLSYSATNINMYGLANLSQSSGNGKVPTKFSQFIIDKETGFIIVASLNEHKPNLFLFNFMTILDSNQLSSFQSNSLGVKLMKASYDMKQLFTCSKDKCIFFFEIMNPFKHGYIDESLVINDLVLCKKSELDVESSDVRLRLQQFDNDYVEEVESFDIDFKQMEKEIYETLIEREKLKQKFQLEKEEIMKVEKKYLLEYENEIDEITKDHKYRVQDIKDEQFRSVNIKLKEKEKEVDFKEIERNKDKASLRNLIKSLEEEITNIKEEYKVKIDTLHDKITTMQKGFENLQSHIEKENDDKIEVNENLISLERVKLEDLKKKYNGIKLEQVSSEEKLINSIKEIKSEIKIEDARRIELKNTLLKLGSDNNKLAKAISDYQQDKKVKEETILEKTEIKKELERENQELEKFKFVLNYKIKELKQEKDPKENKLYSLERQAQDMEKEIRNFEYSQSNYIVDLSTNHEIMKLHERQIAKSEKTIEKLKNYIKLFQDYLYSSLKLPKNHKDLKKELVKLKTLFLDKDFIENMDTPFESNFDVQRNNYESAISEYKQKLENGRIRLSQEFNKIMRENRKLLTIVNELELEKKEVISNRYDVSKSMQIRNKITLKENLPCIFKKDRTSERIIYDLKNELFELEKEIILVKEYKRKELIRNARKKKIKIVDKNIK